MQIKILNYFTDEAYKLFCNGNGVGDKSQFNFAPKSFFKWCDTVFGNTTER